MIKRLVLATCFVLTTCSLIDLALAAEWRIATGGNAYKTAPQPGNATNHEGALVIRDALQTYSLFFSVDQPGKVTLLLEAQGADGAILDVSVGDVHKEVVVKNKEVSDILVGEFDCVKKGYVRVDLKGKEGIKENVQIQSLVVRSEVENLKVDYVRNNEGNMFYWGRRGPSVHLGYQVPRDVNIQYGYSEITVPVGFDPIGSYYMANGFGEGYFGIQVNSESERRVLFSVWSPFQTDNPKDIPEEQRIAVLGRGLDVRIGEFGNEGSGGQSFLIYPWVAGKTYRFLTEVKPDGKGNTIYTSWFGDKAADEWRLIASFRRPKTDTHYKGFHSFLESFNPAFGHMERRVENGNVWVVDTTGKWHECVQARFSVDPTGGNRHRLDYMGGADGDHFYMRNCGFFNETGKAGDSFKRQSTATEKPVIDFDKLPR